MKSGRYKYVGINKTKTSPALVSKCAASTFHDLNIAQFVSDIFHEKYWNGDLMEYRMTEFIDRSAATQGRTQPRG